MTSKYRPASPVRAVAQDIIRDYHAHLIRNAVYVVYLFVDEAEKVKGKTVLGTARKTSGLNAYLARMEDELDGGDPDFFVVTIWDGFWFDRHTTDEQRRALVDHELSHLWSEQEEDRQGNTTGKILLSIKGHDLEEFNCIVERYGDWKPDITAFLEAAADGPQLTLPEFQERCQKRSRA